jgi:hypothetical protein
MKSLAHDWPRCVVRAAAAIQQLEATVPSAESAFSERSEARRWLLAAQEAATRHCSETVVAYLAYRTEWFAQSAATRILDEQRARAGTPRETLDRPVADRPVAALDANPA